MAQTQRTRSAVLRFVEALNGGDPDAIAGLVTEDFLNEHTSTRGVSLHGRDEYRGRLPDFLGQFGALHYDVEQMIVDGSDAAVAYRMTCRWGADGSRRPVSLRGMFRFRVRDDMIAHRIDYWDGSEFDRQVGGAPAHRDPPR